MKEVRAWMDEAEKLIKFIRLQSDPEKETKIQEKIEVMVNLRCILYYTFHQKTLNMNNLLCESPNIFLFFFRNIPTKCRGSTSCKAGCLNVLCRF